MEEVKLSEDVKDEIAATEVVSPSVAADIVEHSSPPPPSPSEAVEAVDCTKDSAPINGKKAKGRGNSIDLSFQKLEEKAKKAEEAHAAEEKLRKELEVLNSKLLAEKTALLDSLAGEKGSLQDFQEKTAKLQAQKNDVDNQLRVSSSYHRNNNYS